MKGCMHIYVCVYIYHEQNMIILIEVKNVSHGSLRENLKDVSYSRHFL